MSILFSSIFLFFAICPYSILQFGLARTPQHPRYELGEETLVALCQSGNLIDKCWACDDDWEHHRQNLADCAIGHGNNAKGGKGGDIYTVKHASDDDAVTPKPGTLRHAVLQEGPLWIIFSKNMIINLKEELIMTSNKTIDGRGVDVVLTGNSGITVQYVHNVIIHGITIHGMKQAGNCDVRSSTDHYGHRGLSDGDAISIFGSKDVWVDHCTLSDCADGLIDVVAASTDVTISNNHFFDHNEVLLFGHNDNYPDDEGMRVTVVYNVFGRKLTQRMPRCRFGLFEVFNNYYPCGWGIYAIGGSSHPTIVSRGNVFVAPKDNTKKEVTFHENENRAVWETYDWTSDDDFMLNGAFFQSSGSGHVGDLSMQVNPHEQVQQMTANAGALESVRPPDWCD